MKSIRSVIFWMHLFTGLTIATVVVVMAATGVLLTYQRQIQAWADTRGLDAGPPNGAVSAHVASTLPGAATEPAASPLSPAVLLERVRAQTDAMITGIRWRAVHDAPVEIQLGRDRSLYVNAYSGDVLGEGSAGTRTFFRTVTDLHRWLALNADIPTGRAITGAANLGFLFMVLSGFYLWWPRRLTRRALRNAMLFRRGLRPRARDFNWHHVIGFWSLAPLLVIIASAAVISYAWVGALVERVAGADPPRPASTQPIRALPTTAAQATTPAIDTPSPGERPELENGDALLTRARGIASEWKSITLELPLRDGLARFIIDTGTGGQPQKQARLTLAAATGDVVAWEPFSSESRAGRFRSLLRYAHTGEVGGIVGQTVAGLVSAGALLLVWTGASLALRRFRSWRKRNDRNTAVPPEPKSIG